MWGELVGMLQYRSRKVALHSFSYPTWYFADTGVFLMSRAERAGRREPELRLTLLHCRHPTSSAGWVRQHTRFFAHSLTQSPNIQYRHSLHVSRNQERPCFNVLNSITKTMSLSWFCIPTAKQSSQGAARQLWVPTWYKYPGGMQIQLCYTELYNATVSFMKISTKCPFNT